MKQPKKLTKPKLSKQFSLPKLPKLSLPSLLNQSTLTHSRFSKANLTIFILIFAGIGGYVLLASHATSSTANVFVSANGSDSGANCKRFTTPITNPDPVGTTLCASFDKAYQMASLGDIVEVEGGSYPSQTIAYTSAKVDGSHCTPVVNNNIANSVVDYSGCITFQPAPSSTVNVVSVTTQAPYVRIKDLILSGLNLGSSPAVNGLACSAIKDHDEVADGITLNGTFTIKGDHNFIINSSINVGGTYTPSSGTSHFNACVQTVGGVTTNVLGNYQGVINTTVKNMIQTQSSNQAGATSFQQQHVAAIHLEGGNHVLIDRNKFINLAGHNLEAQSEGGAPSTDWRITNNFFDTICGSQAQVAAKRGGTTVAGSNLITGLSQTSDLAVGEKVSSIFLPQNPDGSNNTTIVSIDSPSQITLSEAINRTGSTTLTFGGTCEDQGGDDVTASGSALSDVTYSFNTFKTGFPVWTEGSVAMTGTLREIGNIGGGGAPDAFHCSFYKNFDAGVTLDYNVWSSGAKCGPNDVVGAIGFVDSASMDLHIGPGSAYNVVSASVPGGCPTVDIDGDSRPQGAACDAGADEAMITAANIWVDTDGGSCVRSVSYIAYNDATACSSMQTAMTAAQAGDIVIIKNGTYPGQTLSSGTKASVVSFYAETASQVLLSGNLTLDGVDRIHIYGVISAGAGETRSGLNICDTNCKTFTTQDILIDGYAGKSAFIRGTNVVIDHSEFGNFSACLAGNSEDAFRFWDGTGGSVTPTNDVLRNSVIHDVDDGVGDTCQGTVNAGRHVDCMQNNGGINLLFEKNIFYNCPTSNIQDSNFSGATIGSITIQNNFFGKPHCCNSIAIGPAGGTNNDCSNIIVRNNDFDSGSVNSSTCGDGSLGVKVYGNIFFQNIFACTTGHDYQYNIFHPTDGPICGTNYKRCTPALIDALPAWGGLKPNPHISAADTCARDAGDPSSYPSQDFDGDSRPQGVAPDAGADEYVLAASTKPGDLNNDNKVNILDLSILLSHYGQTATSSQGDITGDGRVSILDLSILLSHYGS